MGRPRKPRTQCLNCDNRVKRFGKKFCSQACASHHHAIPAMERRQHKTCPKCKCLFSDKPAVIARRVFCSKECQDIAARKKHDFVCCGCGNQKSSDDFYVDRRNPRGHVARCKECYSKTARTVLRFKPYRREESFKAGAARRGLPYELTTEQFMLFWQRPCYYCGSDIPTVGLDRRDNGAGYTIENVVACCAVCNRIKSDMAIDEFISHCAKITSHCNSAITFGGKY